MSGVVSACLAGDAHQFESRYDTLPPSDDLLDEYDITTMEIAVLEAVSTRVWVADVCKICGFSVHRTAPFMPA